MALSAPSALKPCAICETSDAVRVELEVPWKGASERLLRCGTCGLRFIAEPLRRNRPFEARPGESLIEAWRRQFPDELDVHDQNSWGSKHQDTSDVTRWQVEQVARGFPGVAAPDFAFVELGCANGLLLRAVREAYPRARLLGIEPSPVMAAEVERAGIAVHNGIVETAPLAPASIDGIAAFGSFIQMRDPGAGLAAIAAALRPGGRLLLDIPNDGSLIRALARALAWMRRVLRLPLPRGLVATTLQKAYNPGRFHYYSRSTIGALLARHGMRVDAVWMRQPRYLTYGRHGQGAVVATLAAVVQRIERAIGRENWIVVVATRVGSA